MLKGYKTELNLTNEQKKKINQAIGNCRFIYNYYIAYNKELYIQNQNTNLPTFISGFSFSKMINNDPIFLYKKNNYNRNLIMNKNPKNKKSKSVINNNKNKKKSISQFK